MKSDQESWSQDELDKLDAWIAENFFHFELERDGDGVYFKDADTAGDIPRYSSRPEALALVKREIERRGFDWQCFTRNRDDRFTYSFAILEKWVNNQGLAFYQPIGQSDQETEELAGCLAVKSAFSISAQEKGHERPEGPETETKP